jgi:hypothetical protein
VASVNSEVLRSVETRKPKTLSLSIINCEVEVYGILTEKSIGRSSPGGDVQSSVRALWLSCIQRCRDQIGPSV